MNITLLCVSVDSSGSISDIPAVPILLQMFTQNYCHTQFYNTIFPPEIAGFISSEYGIRLNYSWVHRFNIQSLVCLESMGKPYVFMFLI